MGRRPHVLLVSCPAQGHVAPLMKLAHLISDHGINLTFANVDFVHQKIVAATAAAAAALDEDDGSRRGIELVSIPRGPNPALSNTVDAPTIMPDHIKDLIEKINRRNEDERVTCVVADTTVLCALEVAEKMGIKRVGVWPAAPWCLALALHVPKLIEAGIIDTDGSPLKNELIHLADNIPVFSSTDLWWNSSDDPKMREDLFGHVFGVHQAVKLSDYLLCNSFYELDSSACNLIPDLLPIGPLLATNHPHHHSSGNFWPVDSTCLNWLDKQPAASVIYVAFGSLAVLSQHQFKELALGLELVGRPFLWVVRSDFIIGEFPDGFMERLSENGRIVSWADQEKVLAHPSVVCFLSHCGWNSTVEGVSNGVPFLCWAQSYDQFCNRDYICDIWRVGLRLEPDRNGVVSRHEVKTKIENLVGDDGVRANAVKLKKLARESMSADGSSSRNFKAFIEAVEQY